MAKTTLLTIAVAVASLGTVGGIVVADCPLVDDSCFKSIPCAAVNGEVGECKPLGGGSARLEEIYTNSACRPAPKTGLKCGGDDDNEVNCVRFALFSAPGCPADKYVRDHIVKVPGICAGSQACGVGM